MPLHCSFIQECYSATYQNCGSAVDGWITPTTDLGTFETSCYYFTISNIYWDQAWKTCADMGSGSMLAALETVTEFNWVLQIYKTNYPSAGGFYVDAVIMRYGSAYSTPSWRGGLSLSSGVGSSTSFASWPYDWVYGAGSYWYKNQCYMSPSGTLYDVIDNYAPSNIGYICKKFQSAPYPQTVGYNIGYCFPYLSGESCPSGWTQMTPNDSPFCYYFVTSSNIWEEDFRQCHTLGADMDYLESSSEITFLLNNNINHNANLNAHRFRYGPTVWPDGFCWSNNVTITSNQFGQVNWGNNEPDYYKNDEACVQSWSNYNSLNDISCHNTQGSIQISGPTACKRPACGILNTVF